MDFLAEILSKAAFLDQPEILRFLFHPRSASGASSEGRVREITINTADNVTIGCRLHLAGKKSPNILFFHGNGEIAHDYDTLGPVYNEAGLNFIIADYRGYGISTGNPTISAMFSDAYTVFDYIAKVLEDDGYAGPVWVMGRSLGSAPAVALAAGLQHRIAGLIIESGFAGVRDLLERLDILPGNMAMNDNMFFSNAEHLKTYNGPVLIIHAEKDDIIPLAHGRQLHDAATGSRKTLRIINNANHNNILSVAGITYFEYIKEFIFKK